DCEARLEESQKKYLYLYAELENLRKRMSQERTEAERFAWKPIALGLLETVDSLEKALVFARQAKSPNLTQGLELTVKQLKDLLQKHGIERVWAEGKAFDPNIHEATATAPSELHAEGTVVVEEQPGYTLHGRLLRPARVRVSAGTAKKQSA
ncbi:MAG: nucleotide exchange factor GrpE, partial [Bdellovibrionota bacterium]